VEYKSGKDNKVANALSLRDEDQVQDISLSLIFYPKLDWLSNGSDSQAEALIKQNSGGQL
jgi:hypothetical protein